MSKAMQENIKRQLHAQNMTAAELERRTGIPHAVVNILHGRSKNPSIKTAQAIAKELGCSVEELLSEGTETAPKQNHVWDQRLYTDTFNTLCKQIQELKLQPSAEQVAQWLTDAYNYALGNKDRNVDIRFIQWLLERAV
ncbi:MAG TPA: helix-turn-helix transcriptional regulator [Gammaproteobacteria bacterium]|nr:helix-turn-helix transcriptional regulator [Gammaproteobacteria bacterium]